MSIKRMNAVWNLSKQSGSALLVLLALADRADDDGFCWPGLWPRWCFCPDYPPPK